MTIHYLSAAEVVSVHEQLVKMFADDDPIVPSGLRDPNLLGSALGRPQTGMMGKDKYESIEEKAAALLHSMVMNHPFHNGNKRTALVSVLTFLDRNHRRLNLDVTDDEIFETVTHLAQNHFPALAHGLNVDQVVEELGRWIRARAVPRKTATSEMTTTEFLSKVEAAGGSYKKSGGSWVVRGRGTESVRISNSARKLDGNVVRTYVTKLGLAGASAAIHLDEFQQGIPPEQEILLRFRNVLRRLANA